MDSGKVFIEMHFTDLMGVLRATTLVVSKDLVSNPSRIKGFFDASSVFGFEPIENSDLMLKPVDGTLRKLPWYTDVYRCISGVYWSDGKRYVKDPRLVAEKTMEYMRSQGLEPSIGIEMEFFLFNSLKYGLDYTKQYLEINSTESIGASGYSIPPKKGYHLTEPYDSIASTRREIIANVEKLGFKCSKMHHEVASFGQVEVTSGKLGVDNGGDFVQTFKYVARITAEKNGYTAVFLPKPIPGDNGSGMHVHVSLWNGDKNLFYDEDGVLSQVARYFIGGLIEHGRSLSALVSPTVNSYKRLVPGYEAPVYLVWGYGNRSAAIRIPVVRDEKTFRIEYRPPDPSANPYLALSAIILAGLDGIKKKIEPGDPFEKNVYHLTEKERKTLGIKSLPRSLLEALDELESDNEYLKPVFPRELLESYIELKRKEAIDASSMPAPSDYIFYGIL
ncbi:type I glutamate--ammonia ligase [Desulfurococcaceae archaeon MEX13E-LK6-19]|nr:type I glutamate--ammonia ligase [Desulfurococcaceae archaeon MEX13E-LK6-19]